jgi:hypothetical protein
MKARPVICQTQLHEYAGSQQQRLVMPFAALHATRWGCVVSLGNSGICAKGGR